MRKKKLPLGRLSVVIPLDCIYNDTMKNDKRKTNHVQNCLSVRMDCLGKAKFCPALPNTKKHQGVALGATKMLPGIQVP